MQRQRVAAQAAPANVANREDLVLPIGYTLYTRLDGAEEHWIKLDTGPDEERILIFSLDRNLDYLATCRVSTI